ncbi:hypothetical protein BB561_006629 [Smittium simulii]|uniref:Uncharacterized protein n=1 Tax=Smittium simulii TaxID=133385 RepID=A0A2T9Y2Q8_9FUNG|nr:hypothetical protein BB561_006629 [Smittium simulii]
MGGSASKLEFRKHIFKLSEQKNLSAEDSTIWSPFWLMPQTVHDVFSLITPKDISRIKAVSPENFSTLYFKILERLQELLKNKNSTKDKNLKLQILNCIRVLTRLTPFIYENVDSSFENSVLWKTSTKESDSFSEIGYLLAELALNLMFVPGLTVLEEINTAEFDQAKPDTPETDQKGLPQSDSKYFDQSCEKYPIWADGIGVRFSTATTLTTNNEIFSNRLEVLRFILALISKDLYSPAQTILESQNKILLFIITHSNSQLLLSVLCSLLNSALRVNKSNLLQIGYKSEFLSNDNQSLVSIYSALLFSVFMSSLNYSGGKKNRFYSFVTKIYQKPDFDSIINNSMAIINMAYENSQSIIATVTQTQNNKIEFASSIILILFQISESNSNFLNYLSDHNHLPNLFTTLSCLLLLYRNESTKSGICKFIGLLFHKLSENKNFSIAMMRPFTNYYTIIPAHLSPSRNLDFKSAALQDERVYKEIQTSATNSVLGDNHTNEILTPSEGSKPEFGSHLNADSNSDLTTDSVTVSNYTDFLIQYTYIMVSESNNNLKPVYSDLFITLRNISPHITNISLYSIKCLFLMFKVFSSPAFMIVDRLHIQWLNCMLECFDYILHYHMTDNPYFVYQLLDYKETLNQLSTFNYEEAASMLDNLKKSKELQEAKRNIPTDLNSDTSGILNQRQPLPSSDFNGKLKSDDTAILSRSNSSNVTNIDSKKVEDRSKSQSVYSNSVPKEFVLQYLNESRVSSILSIINSLEPHISEINGENNEPTSLALQVTFDLLSSEKVLTLIPHAHLDTALRKPAESIHKLAVFGNNGKSLFLINFKSEIWGRIISTCSSPINLFKGSNVKLVLIKRS